MLFVTTALARLPLAAAGPDPGPVGPRRHIETVIVTSDRESTHSAVEINNVQAQKILPGISPLKAIQSLPGVLYATADPWGNNEQNESLVVHGFTTQQLGYTMDGVPLGDQQYGNYNGLSPSRAVTSENVRACAWTSGAGSLGVASTSNLGGAIETFSSDPHDSVRRGCRARPAAAMTPAASFLRLDCGDIGDGFMRLSVLSAPEPARLGFRWLSAWRPAQPEIVHANDVGKFTFYADWNSKVEPNEDAISVRQPADRGGAGLHSLHTPVSLSQPGRRHRLCEHQPGPARHAAGRPGQQFLQLSQRRPARGCADLRPV